MPMHNLDELLGHVDSKYRLVILAAKRAKQLMRGADPLVGSKSFKPIYIALDELASGKLHFETEEAQAELTRELDEAGRPTWFRSMVAEEAEGAEEEMAEEVTEGEEAPEPEAPPEELPGEPAELLPEEELGEGAGIEALHEEEIPEQELPPASEEE